MLANYMILTVGAHGNGNFGEFGHDDGGHGHGSGHHIGHGDVGADLFPWILG